MCVHCRAASLTLTSLSMVAEQKLQVDWTMRASGGREESHHVTLVYRDNEGIWGKEESHYPTYLALAIGVGA